MGKNTTWNTAVADVAREQGIYREVMANWSGLDRSLTPKKAVKALALTATVKASDKAKTTAKPARKSTEPRTERTSVVNGQVRVITREAGRIVANRAATKAEAKAAGLKGKTAPKTAPKTTAQRQVKVEGKWVAKPSSTSVKSSGKRFLSSKSRLDYIAAAMEQDSEYLDAIREFFGIDAKVNPSTRECAFYALTPEVGLKVPGFKIGKGYKAMYAEYEALHAEYLAETA